jgi:hypothetical protein
MWFLNCRMVETHFNYICILVLTSFKMATWLAETCWWLLCNKITYVKPKCFCCSFNMFCPTRLGPIIEAALNVLAVFLAVGQGLLLSQKRNVLVILQVNLIRDNGQRAQIEWLKYISSPKYYKLDLTCSAISCYGRCNEPSCFTKGL